MLIESAKVQYIYLNERVVHFILTRCLSLYHHILEQTPPHVATQLGCPSFRVLTLLLEVRSDRHLRIGTGFIQFLESVQ